MSLMQFSGQIGDGCLPDGTRAWQFVAHVPDSAINRPWIETMVYVTDERLAASLAAMTASPELPRMVEAGFATDLACSALRLSHPSLPVALLKFADPARRAHDGDCCWAVIHPCGDRSRLALKKVLFHEEDDWAFASEDRFDFIADAYVEMRRIQEDLGCSIDFDVDEPLPNDDHPGLDDEPIGPWDHGMPAPLANALAPGW